MQVTYFTKETLLRGNQLAESINANRQLKWAGFDKLPNDARFPVMMHMLHERGRSIPPSRCPMLDHDEDWTDCEQILHDLPPGGIELRDELAEFTLDALRELEAHLALKLDRIKSQLDEARSRKRHHGEVSDPDWFQRASDARRVSARQHQAVLRAMGDALKFTEAGSRKRPAIFNIHRAVSSI